MESVGILLDYFRQSGVLCIQHDCSPPPGRSTTLHGLSTQQSSNPSSPQYNFSSTTSPASYPPQWPISSTLAQQNLTSTSTAKPTPPPAPTLDISSPDTPVVDSTESTVSYKPDTSECYHLSTTDKDFTSCSTQASSVFDLDWSTSSSSVPHTPSSSIRAISEVSADSNITVSSHQPWSRQQTTSGSMTLMVDDVSTTSEMIDGNDDHLLWWVILYGVIVIVGILSNVFAVLSILLMKKLRTGQNMFVLNLCVADIFLGINALFTFVTIVNPDISIQDTECHILAFFTFIPPLAVVLSMTVIARNRYQVIVKMNGNQDVKKVTLRLLLVWVISIVVSIPILSDLISVETYLFCTCCFYFSHNLIYALAVTFFVSIIPNLVILYSYVCIFRVIRKSRRKVQNHKSNAHLVQNRRGDIRLAIQFIILFAVFNICYLPTMIVFWTVDETDGTTSGPLRAFIMILFACNLIANPVIYFIMNKLAMSQLKSCCCGKGTDDGVVGQGAVIPKEGQYATTQIHKTGTSPGRIAPIATGSGPQPLGGNGDKSPMYYGVNDKHIKARQDLSVLAEASPHCGRRESDVEKTSKYHVVNNMHTASKHSLSVRTGSSTNKIVPMTHSSSGGYQPHGLGSLSDAVILECKENNPNSQNGIDTMPDRPEGKVSDCSQSQRTSTLKLPNEVDYLGECSEFSVVETEL